VQHSCGVYILKMLFRHLSMIPLTGRRIVSVEICATRSQLETYEVHEL